MNDLDRTTGRRCLFVVRHGVKIVKKHFNDLRTSTNYASYVNRKLFVESCKFF